MIAKVAKFLLVAGLIMASTRTVLGFVLTTPPTIWLPGTVPIQIKLGTSRQLTDGTNFSTSVQTAMQTWNGQIGTVQFAGQIAPVGISNSSNDVNEMVFNSSVEGDNFGSGVLAITLTNSYGSGQTATSDIIFNSAYGWDSYRGALHMDANGNPTQVDIRRVALHELGHVLGLDHPDEHGQSVTAVMNSEISNLDALAPDDIAGAQSLYRARGDATPPPNDNFAAAIDITLSGNSAQLSGSNVYATKESSEPAHAAETGIHSVWWKWTAASNGNVTFDTQGSFFDTVLAAYTGSAIASLTAGASNDDASDDPDIQYSTITFATAAGTTYYIAVDGYSAADSGKIALNVSFVPDVVNVLPAFTSTPAGQTIFVGQSANFSISANGLPSPTLQWQRLPTGNDTWVNLTEGGNYSGTTAPTLTVTSVTLAMNGDKFRCLASNIVGQATSDIGVLSVNPVDAPHISGLPTIVILNKGDPVTLTPSVTGTGPISYQWYKGGEAVSGATAIIFINNSMEPTDQGSYTLVATNGGGSTASAAVTIRVGSGSPKGVVAVAAGGIHTLFIKADGTLWVMGYNADGELGDGSTSNHVVPLEIATNVAACSAGSSSSFFIKSDATLWAMGSNHFGELGDGSNSNQLLPVQVASGIVAVAVGYNHSLILKNDGSLWATGANSHGQLGDHTTTDRSTPVQIATGVAGIAAGGNHSLFIKADQTLWAMGQNFYGELGDGTTTDRSNPVQIATGVSTVSAGANHTVLLKTDGTAWTMGLNAVGCLGDGTTTNRFTAVQVASQVVLISAAAYDTLFLRSDAEIRATGDNSYSQIYNAGALEVFTPPAFPQPAADPPTPPAYLTVPSSLSFGMVGMAAGGRHNLYFDASGDLYGTGDNSYGELGAGSNPGPVAPFLLSSGPLTTPAKPSDVTGVSDSISIKLNWKPSLGAEGYEVWRNTTNNTVSAQKIAGKISLSLYYDTSAVRGKTYFYWIKATRPGAASSFSAVVKVVASPSIVDFNGDGKTDILWRQPSPRVGEVGTWLMDGLGVTGYTAISIMGPDYVVGGAGDMNGDGKTDILWRKNTNGEVGVWLMNGTFVSSYVVIGNRSSDFVIEGTGDFNGDGKTDILWRNLTTGEVGVWLMNGTVVSSYVVIGNRSTDYVIGGTGDFNGDGQTDIVWRKISTGEVGIWLMQGTTVASYVTIGRAGAEYVIAGAGDYNGDGETDILWRKTTTGEVGIWLMNGTGVNSYVVIGNAGTDYVIVGSGEFKAATAPVVSAQIQDFNSDGKSDIVWENTVTGDRSIWLMNGGGLSSIAYLANVSPDWHIAAKADFNGDGKPDIVWEDNVTGDRSIWLMNGTGLLSIVFLANVSADWHIAATVDANGDGQSDLVWENAVTGDRSVWVMNGTQLAYFIYLGTISPDWHIAAAADVNGDGKTDFIWENTVTGDRTIWFMNGSTFLSSLYLAGISVDWHIAAAEDFNGDGQPDLVWENRVTGDRTIWFMDGTSLVSSLYLAGISPDWRITP